MSDTIESLELEIKANSTAASDGIDALTESLVKLKTATKGGLGLSSISKQINNLNSASIDKGKITSLVDSLSPLSKLSKSNLSSFITPLKKLPDVFSELNKIDLSAFGAKIQEVATAMKPLADEMEKVSNGFSSFPTKIQKLLKSTGQIPDKNKKAAISFTDLYHKMKVGINIIKRVGSTIWSAIEQSMDYTENMNLFSVAMGEYAEEAYAYAEKVSDAMGIDTSEWIRAQGVFMTLSTGFGIAGDRANTMSKNLTQLGYDLASFYNMDVADTMQKLQSGLSGELEPLRRLGYDLSQARLEATAAELGITKAVSAMTQAEKAQLRYYAIMTQVTDTHGDMARTLDAPANQIRVLKAEFNMAAREIGNVFIPTLNKLLPYVIAVTKVIGSLANTIAGLFGFKDEGISESTNTVVESTSAVEENLEGAQEEAKKLKSYMLGFDELNVINPNEGSEVDTSSMFEFELPEYDFLADAVESKVNVIVDEMKEWLGITDDIDSWADLFSTKLGIILGLVVSIGAGIAAWKISAGLIASVKAIKGFFAAISTLGAAVAGGIGAIVAGVGIMFTGIYNAVIEGLDWLSGTLTAFGATLIGFGIGAFFGPWGMLIGAAIGLAVGLITDLVIFIVQKWDEISAWFKGIPEWFNTKIVEPIVNFFKGLWEAVSGFFVNLWNGIVDIWKDVANWFNTMVVQPIVNFFKPIVKFISKIFEGLWIIIRAVWVVVSTWFNDTVVQPIVGFFKGLWESVSGFFRQLWEDICAIWEVVSTWFNDTVIKPVVAFFKGLWESVLGFFKSLWEGIKGVWKSVSTWFSDTIITPVKTAFKTACDAIGKFFDNLWLGIRQGVANAMNGVIGAIESAINWIVRGINSLMDGFNKVVEWGADVIGADWDGITVLREVSLERITVPKYADGGFPEQGQMFIAREAGAEMVGSIGRRTAVANNDQIVGGIAHGVAEANEEQNVLLREQNSILRALLDKEFAAYLDGRKVTEGIEQYQRERGRVLVTGGVI